MPDTDGVPRRRPGRPATKLSRERIVAAAVEMAAEGGTAAISFRLLAERLGVAPMSLYRHVHSQTDLLVAVVDRLMEDDPPPKPPPLGRWRAHVRWAARYLLHVFTAFPGVRAAFLAEPVASRHLVDVFERLLDSLVSAGCEPGLAADVDFVLLNAAIGFAGFEEESQKRFAAPAERLDILRYEFERVSPARYPRIATVRDRIAAFNDRAQFERNVEVIVEGAGSLIEKSIARGERRSRRA